MRTVHRTGLPQFDQESYNKGLSDGQRGAVWWPGVGTEPLSYTVGYREAGVRNPRTDRLATTTKPEVPAPNMADHLESLTGAQWRH